MKLGDFDHVAIKVKDLDKAMQFFNKLFGLEFEEVPVDNREERRGVRGAISRPDPRIELLSVVDPVKATKMEEFLGTKRFVSMDDGIFRLFFRVEDADEAVADAERAGIRIERVIEEEKLMDFIPPFKEIFFNEEDVPCKWLSLIYHQGEYERI